MGVDIFTSTQKHASIVFQHSHKIMQYCVADHVMGKQPIRYVHVALQTYWTCTKFNSDITITSS